MPFILGKSQEEETRDEDLAEWIYKDLITIEIPQAKLPTDQYGKGLLIMQRMGYDGQSALGPCKQGRHEPLQPELKQKDNTGLGFQKDILHKLRFKGKPSQPLYQPITKRSPLIIKATSNTIAATPLRLKILAKPCTTPIILPIKSTIPSTASTTPLALLEPPTVSTTPTIPIESAK